MSAEDRRAEADRHPDSPVRRVDAACDRFEAAWRAGRRLRIEDLVAEAPELERPGLLRELIALEVELRRGEGERPTPEEYLDRCPGQADAVGAAFAETVSGARGTGARSGGAATDSGRNLLFGLLAFQNNFIDREALLGAFDAWVVDRSRGLARILLERGALSPSRHMVLEALVEEHIRLHHEDPEESLASLGPVGSLRDDLSRSTDPDIQSSVSRLQVAGNGRSEDPVHTAAWPPADDPSAAGHRFRVLRPHATGGLGEVFIALDTELNRDVALKEIRAQFADDPHYRSRFEFEAEVTGGLEHPGIVPVYGLGHTPDGRPFYAMRFIKGESLKEAVRRFHEAERRADRGRGRSTLALRELLGRFMDVCDAMAYAHSRGVLHRDLKPGNIMLGKYGETLVVDWGLAKALDRGEPEVAVERSEMPLKPSSGDALEPTMAGSAVGTPGYMSPEQASGRVGELGVRSDVYGLGATLYHILTGHAPCEAEDRGAVYRKVIAGEVPRPRSLNPRIPRALEAVCLKAIAYEPANRYESAEALKADLERWLADEPVQAYPEPWPARAARRVRRHRSPVAAAVALVPLALIGLAIHDWQLGREKARTAELLDMTGDEQRRLLEFAGARLAEVPNSMPLRQEFAQYALGRNQELARKFPNDPRVQLQKAHILRVIAGIERLAGRFSESDRAYGQAIQILAALSAEDPGRFEYPRWLVEALNDRGELYRMNGRSREAEALFNSAIARSEALLIWPIGPPYRRAKGSALINLSDVLVLEDRPQEARQWAGQAVELLEPIALGSTGSRQTARDRWLLSLALTLRGVAAGQVGDDRAAARDLDEAEAVAKAVKEDDRYYEDLQFQLAYIDRLRGERISRVPSSIDEAEAALERALRRLTDLIEKNQFMPQFEEEMAAALSARAAVRLAQHHLDDAQADCRAAIARLEHLIEDQARRRAPENPQYFSLLGQADLLAGRIQTDSGRPREGRRLRDQGVDHLRRAVQIDGARMQDARILDRIGAETDRDPRGEGRRTEGQD
jgi:serine/threonine-protein kinase